jgi:hypothetical protein
MSKHKVKRYDGEDESMVESDAMEEANKGENLDAKAMAMPRRPISRTPVAASSRGSGPGRKPSGASRADYSNEGKGDSKYRKQTMTPESQALERVYPEQYLGMPGIKGIAAAAKNLANSGAKEAPPMVSAARGALDRAMSAERAAPKTGEMAQFSEALKAAKNAPRPVSKPTPSQAAFAKGPKGSLGRQSAAERDAILRGDTMDEFGAAMKRGGSVKKMASGGSISSRADGIAQRGKTRGKMC